MKQFILILIIISLEYSCAEKTKQEVSDNLQIEVIDNENTERNEQVSDNLVKTIDDLSKLLNAENENQEKRSVENVALEKLLEISGIKETGNDDSFEDLLPISVFVDILEASGVSREEMEKLISNPDSLRILTHQAEKQRQESHQAKSNPKNKLSTEERSSKNTTTGVSLEEAILMVQAESGPEATLAKLKKIDSLSTTNIMEQLDMTETGYVLSDIERKNEPKASLEEEEKMKVIRKRSGQLHSVKEAEQFLAELKMIENEIELGAIKVSPNYQKTIAHQKKNVNIYIRDFIRKSTAARKKFEQLNPELHFGDEVGETYFGDLRQAVFLPLGKRSFADKVIEATHPQLLIQQVKSVLGEPDVIKGFLPEDITGIHSLGLGGELTIQFIDNALTNVNGPDLYIFEIGQIEPTDLEISKDGKSWIKVGKIDGGVAEVDIEAFVEEGELFYYVRLKDLKKESGLPGADVDAIAAIGAAMRLQLDSQVLFDSGKSVLKPSGKEAIKKLASSIKVLKSGRVIVEGHTDDVGSDDINQSLSLARAKSVSAELKELITSKNFKWQEKGLGESKPLVENDSDSNRSKNRRVEILVLPH